MTTSTFSLSERQLERKTQISSSAAAAAEASVSPGTDTKAMGAVAEALPAFVELSADKAVRFAEVVAIDAAVADDHGATTAAAVQLPLLVRLFLPVLLVLVLVLRLILSPVLVLVLLLLLLLLLQLILLRLM